MSDTIGDSKRHLEQQLSDEGNSLQSGQLSLAAKVLNDRRHLDLSVLTAPQQLELIASRANTIITTEELQLALDRAESIKRPLHVKLGIDPTGSDVHIGHLVPMIVASRFQRMGHRFTLIVGDFTAKIGDPSDRSGERPLLSDEQIQENLGSYQQQIAPFFDFKQVELRHNSEWLSEIGMDELIKLLSQIPVSMQLQREDFRKRLEAGHTLSSAEFLYSVFMAYDSVAIEADLELGGLDQLLNMQMCRKVMEIRGLKPEVVVTTGLIEGTDGSGAKMSKSLNNYVGLNEPAEMIFGKLMSIPDRLLETYFKALTEMTDNEWQILAGRMEKGEFNPMQVKKLLAMDLVMTIYGPDEVQTVLNNFEAHFSSRKLSTISDIKTVSSSAATDTPKATTTTMLTSNDLAKSNSDARRKAKAEAIRFIIEQADGTQTEIRLDESQLNIPFEQLLDEVIKPKMPENSHLFIRVGRQVAQIII